MVEQQNNFLETTLGKTINTAIDIGLRAVLPDMIEEQVIDIKNVLFNNGLKEGIDVNSKEYKERLERMEMIEKPKEKSNNAYLKTSLVLI